MMRCAWLACLVLIGLVTPGWGAKLELKNGDRVAFIGDTFVEREQVGDYIETMLLSRFPDQNVTFRNLGYSADTPTGSARGLCTGWSTFENADQGFARLKKLVAEIKPTVMLVNYGMTESFGGPAQLPTFVENYNHMLDALISAAGTSPRLVLLSPNYHEDLGRPLPDPSEHDKNLRLYSQAIGQIAAKRHAVFSDLFALTRDAAHDPPGTPLTFNGIHLTPYGYWRTALAIEAALGYPPREWRVELNAGNANAAPAAVGTKVSDVRAAPHGLSFTALDSLLPPPSAPKESPKTVLDGSVIVPGTQHVLRVTGLAPGTYALRIGDDTLATASAQQWATGVQTPPAPQTDALRRALIAKDFDYFNYQRPENDSYILAFRRHEQGKHAVEIPEFLPLVQEKEAQIAKLRVPEPATYRLVLMK